mgnify:CR=1 FL=1
MLLAVMMVLAMVACAAKQAETTTEAPAAAETTTETTETAEPVEETATEAASEGKTELNIGVLVWKYSDTYGSSVRVAMDKYAKEIGAEKGLTINLEMQDGNDDQATQNNQADVMFAAGKTTSSSTSATPPLASIWLTLPSSTMFPSPSTTRSPLTPPS